MILADTSVWVNHLRGGDSGLTELLESDAVLVHPFVIGEVALGNLRNRDYIIADLGAPPHCVTASDEEVMALIESRQLYGLGIGWIDAHLVASVLLTPRARLLTYDKRLAGICHTLGLAV